MENPWWEIDNIAEIASPALLVYPDHIQDNIAEMIRMVGDAGRLRPHVKTHKLGEVTALQLKAGIRKFKCATIAEAEMLGESKAPDVLIAYQMVGPNQVRFANLVEHFQDTKYASLIDDKKTAKELSDLFVSRNIMTDVFLDLNNGCNRTGIQYAEGAFDLYKYAVSLPGLNVRGIHAYDGHVRSAALKQRKSESNGSFVEVEKMVAEIEKEWNVSPEVVMGGSPTFGVHASREKVDCSPGTCLLWDWGYARDYPELKFKFGAVLISRIISKPAKNRICLDLGHKAVAADQPLPRVQFLNIPKTIVLGHSEEHLILEVEDNSDYEIGDVFYGIPFHICPTTALHQRVGVVKNKEVKEYWNVNSRNRVLTF